MMGMDALPYHYEMAPGPVYTRNAPPELLGFHVAYCTGEIYYYARKIKSTKTARNIYAIGLLKKDFISFI